MNSIDPIRLTRIISSISPQEQESTRARPKNSEQRVLDAGAAAEAKDIKALQTQLRHRLARLRSQRGDEFEAAAPQVLVQEIILWEFGEDFINHPEYRQISEFVASSIGANEALTRSLKLFLSSILTGNAGQP